MNELIELRNDVAVLLESANTSAIWANGVGGKLGDKLKIEAQAAQFNYTAVLQLIDKKLQAAEVMQHV